MYIGFRVQIPALCFSALECEHMAEATNPIDSHRCITLFVKVFGFISILYMTDGRPTLALFKECCQWWDLILLPLAYHSYFLANSKGGC